MIPDRVQRSRKAGSKQPPNTRYCGRGTKYGNKYKVSDYKDVSKWDAHKYAFWHYAGSLQEIVKTDPAYYDDLLNYEHLSCFCPLDMPCHVDAIIEHLKRRVVEVDKP